MNGMPENMIAETTSGSHDTENTNTSTEDKPPMDYFECALQAAEGEVDDKDCQACGAWHINTYVQMGRMEMTTELSEWLFKVEEAGGFNNPKSIVLSLAEILLASIRASGDREKTYQEISGSIIKKLLKKVQKNTQS